MHLICQLQTTENGRAKRIPSEQNSFRRLRLKQWLSQETRFIDMADWDRCSGVVDLAAAKELTWYGGLDLSTKLDVTALVLVSLSSDGRFNVLPHFWIPKDNLSDRSNQESAKYRHGADKADHTHGGQRGGLRSG